MALVPIRGEDRILGLIHVADPRDNMVPLEVVEVLEGAAMQLGTAIQRVRAEEALRDSAWQWQTTFDAIGDGVWLADREGRMLRCNEAMTKLLGKPFSEIIGRPCWELVHGMSEPIEGCPFERMRETCRRETLVLPIGERWLDDAVDPLLDEDGNLVGAVHVMTDITDLKRAEERVQRLLSQQIAANRLALALGEARDLGKIYHTIYEHVRTLMDAEAFIISFYDSHTRLIHAGYVITMGVVRDVANFLPIPLEEEGHGTQSQVIHTGELLYIPDYRKAMERTQTEYNIQPDGTVVEGPPPPEKRDESTNSALYVPMKVEGQTIGVMQVQSHGLDAYSQEDIDLLSAMANVAAIAIQNVRLYEAAQQELAARKLAEEKVRRHLERAEALREIDKAIISTLDLTEVLDIILEELERVIPYHSAGIFLFSDGTAKLTAGRGFPDLERVLQVSFLVKEDPLTCELVQEKRPLVLTDAQADERFLARADTGYVRSWIGVPLIAKGKAVGFLTIDHREPGVYDEESADMAEAFASQVAIAIENARLYEEAQRELADRKRAEEGLRQSLERLRRSLEGTVNVLVSAIEMRDPYTAGHQRRVTDLACAIAREMGVSGEQIEGIRMAGLIHDIGKISVPAEILSKPSQLNRLEWGMIQAHPQIGYDILKEIDFPWPVAETVLQHHERLDGSGYPQGLSGEGIILEARVLAVADVVEAMASHRPYRPARGIDEALEEISQNSGVLYDPEVVEACLKLFTEKGFKLD